MNADTLCRNRHLQNMVDAVRKLSDPLQEKILGAFGEANLARVVNASPTEWVTIDLDLEFTRAIRDVLGPEVTHTFFYRLQMDEFRGPLFRILVDAGSAIFGMDAGSWAKWIPKGWGQAFRNCGHWKILEVEPGVLQLRLEDLPLAVLGDEAWLNGLASSMATLFELTRCRGKFVLCGIEMARNCACFEMRWLSARATRGEDGPQLGR
jgi:hypothetical protein